MTLASFRWRVALPALSAFVAVTGCAAEGDLDAAAEATTEARVQVAPQVMVADVRATSAASVDADRITLPLAGSERYLSLSPGAVLVGARGAASGKNPDGFLRRVAAVEASGDTLVIRTTPAALTDAIVDGTLKASSGGGGFDDHVTMSKLDRIDVDFSDRSLFENVDVVEAGGKSGTFTESIHIEHGVLSAQPSVDVDVSIREGKVSRFVAKVEGNLDTSVRAVARVAAAGAVDDAVLAALKEKKHEAKRVLHRSKRVPLPTFSVGRIPVSPSVQVTVTMQCNLAFGGAVHATAGVDAKSFLRLGGVYADGAWGPPIQSEFDIRPSFAVSRGAELDARCSVVFDAELFFYGESSVTMSVAPYLDFEVAAGKPRDFGRAPFVWDVRAGATGAMRGHGPIFGLSPDALARDLVEWTAADSLHGSTP